MDELITINRVSASMGISSRTLRYWESAGLFKSVRDAQSGWRMYDDYALQCIRVTDLLRRLDFSISDIKEVMELKTIDALCDVLRKQLRKLSKTRSDLESRTEAISELITMLKTEPSLTLSSLENILLTVAVERKKHIISKPNAENICRRRAETANASTLFSATEEANVFELRCKLQGGFSMGNVKGKFDEVQIVKMAPMRAAAFTCVGTEPEDEAFSAVKEWIEKNNLEGTMRLFGFNVDPFPTADNPAYGFGFCATVPEGTDIPDPLFEMRLPGGIYAVVSQYEGDPSYGWRKVNELCNDSEWEWEFDNTRNPGLEEHIERANGGFIIPILFPVKKK